MILSQSWIGYLVRSYEQIKQSLLARLSVTNPEITDHSENNILVVIISMFAGVAEMLNLYIDNMAREAYIGTARKYTSVVGLANLMDYNVKAINPASTNEAFMLNEAAGVDITIPAGTQFSNGVGLIFVLPTDLLIPVGITKIYRDIVQYTETEDTEIGISDGTPLQSFLLSTDYVHRSLIVTIDGDIWTEYNSFGLMNPDTKGYVISITEDRKAYLSFGDNTNGLIPTTDISIVERHRESSGASGNIPPNTINIIESELTLPDGITLTVNNENYASGGENFEEIDDVRNRAPRMLRSLETAKTYQDYLDLPILVPGVQDAALKFCCGKFIDLFIAPKGRGIATQTLLDSVHDYMEPRKMITTFLHYYAAGISKVWIKGKVYGKPLIKALQIQLQVADALDKKYGWDVAEINKRIVVSEIISLIENLSLVDHFDLEQVKISPFARPIDLTTTTLNINITALPVTDILRKYKVAWNTDHFDIYLDDLFVTTVLPDGSYIDSVISFDLPAGVYVNGDAWELTVFPTYPEIFPATLIAVNDFSEPVVDVAVFTDSLTEREIFGDIEIIETTIVPAQLTIC